VTLSKTLLALLDKVHEEHTDDWWVAFELEMQAIGARVTGGDVNGETHFACPGDKVAEAKKIVAKYTAKRRAK
jgi:hypothetical protein